MKIICAWCGDFEGEKEPFLSDDITHSICEKCYASFYEPLGNQAQAHEYMFLLKKIETINKWIERALYEKTTPEKNNALFHALKHLACLNKHLD